MEYQERFPELYQAMNQATSLQELNALRRQIIKQMDEGTLSYPACDGAIDAFKKQISKKFGEVVKVRSAQEVREDLLLHTRDSSGKRSSRKW